MAVVGTVGALVYFSRSDAPKDGRAGGPTATPTPTETAAATPTATPSPDRARPFAASSFWNSPLAADAPLDARSDQLVAELDRQVQKAKAARSGPWINTIEFSVPVYTVGRDQPTEKVQLDVGYQDLQKDFDVVPMPDEAEQAAGSDGHLVVRQPSTGTMWEFFKARKDGDIWRARWGGKMTRLSKQAGYFHQPIGATATGLPLLGGLMTLRELKAGRIDHALALGIPDIAKQVTWPAQRGDGKESGAKNLPSGVRFRLDPDVDVEKLDLPPVAKAMARAAQRYGIVLRDTAGVPAFYAEDPKTEKGERSDYDDLFGGDLPSEVLKDFPWDRVQALETGTPKGAPRGA